MFEPRHLPPSPEGHEAVPEGEERTPARIQECPSLGEPVLLPALLACSSPPPETLTVYVDSNDPALDAITSLVEHVGDDRLTVSVESASIAQAEKDEELAIVIEPSGECEECYVLRDEDGDCKPEPRRRVSKDRGRLSKAERRRRRRQRKRGK